MGARFEALIEGVLMAPLDFRYTQVGFNLISVQVCYTLKSLPLSKVLLSVHLNLYQGEKLDTHLCIAEDGMQFCPFMGI